MYSKTILCIAAFAIATSAAAVVPRPTSDLQAPLGAARSSGPSAGSRKTAATPSSSRKPAAAPSSNSFTSDTIRSFEQTASEDGSYRYAYETDAGVKVEEQGVQKVSGDVQALAVAGSYSYTAPDGTAVKLTYVADENGFQPTGDHLPVAPPVPEAIQRALLYIQSHPSSQ